MAGRLLVQIWFPVVVISLVLLAVTSLTAWGLWQMQADSAKILADNLTTLRAAREFETSLQEVQSALTDCLASGDRRSLSDLPALRAKSEKGMAEVLATASTPTARELAAKMKRAHERCATGLLHIELETSPAIVQPKIREVSHDLLAGGLLPEAHNYVLLTEQEIGRSNQDSRVFAKWLAYGLLAVGVLGSALGLVFGFGVARRVSRSLNRLKVPLREAAGTLHAKDDQKLVSDDTGLGGLEKNAKTIGNQIAHVLERLKQHEREIYRVEQLAAVGRLAAGLAHELRNPLMAMKVLVQIAGETGPEGALHGRDLGILEDEIGRMEESLGTFLDFARPPRLEKRRFELRREVDQAVSLVSGRAAQQGVRITCMLPSQPVVVEADPINIRQLLLNLLLNALDATPRDGTIWVDMLRFQSCNGTSINPHQSTTAPTGWITISVSDTGKGLPPDLGERIFDPFTSTKDSGYGLGLSTCRRIAEAHGGEITASDRIGGGTVFTVHLPVPEESMEAGEGGPESKRVEGVTRRDGVR
jgi:two-component system, NtrC family, sensor histidine kinase HydH